MAYDVTSQWDDAHRKLGNYAPLPVEKKQEEYTTEAMDVLESHDPFADKDLDELDELEDDFDDDFLEMYKQKKMAELKVRQALPRFGYVREITRQDYIDQVRLDYPSSIGVNL